MAPGVPVQLPIAPSCVLIGPVSEPAAGVTQRAAQPSTRPKPSETKGTGTGAAVTLCRFVSDAPVAPVPDPPPATVEIVVGAAAAGPESPDTTQAAVSSAAASRRGAMLRLWEPERGAQFPIRQTVHRMV